MINYAFILGRKNLLSVAELLDVFDKRDHVFDISSEALVAGLQEKLQRPQEALNRLGGTIKIAEIFGETPISQSDFASPVSGHLINLFKDRNTKCSYGLSLYSFPQRHEQILKKLLIRVKKELKSSGIKSRFINKNFTNLKNAAIAGEKLLEDGAEICIIRGVHKIYFAQTVALQDFEAYSRRDYDRPARDPKLGMLPPKLAQIMINLGGYTKLAQAVPPDTTIYDPFAGIGTILTEGLLLGYNVVGSDISAEVLHKATQNLEWLKQNFRTDSSCDIFAKDATALTLQDLPKDISVVVTESYLGPPLSQLPDNQHMKKTFHHIQEILIRFFRAIHPAIRRGTPIIVSFLAYRGKNRMFTMDALPAEIKKIGYNIVPLIPKDLSTKFSLPSTENLIYDRPDQIVARQIWKFVRT